MGTTSYIRHSRTLGFERLGVRQRERLFAEGVSLTTDEYSRPQTRGECTGGEHAARPCPFVSCKYHLFLDIEDRTGSLKLNFPDREVWEMGESCALDVADRDGVTLEEVGEALNVTRERIRQVEARALVKIRKSKHASEL